MNANGLIKGSFDLAIDSSFMNLIPPLTAEERHLLETSLLANGCETPLFIWNGTIVDGHNRYAICKEHGIPFAVVEKTFNDRDEAMLWIVEMQLGRRNLNDFQRCRLALQYKPMLAAKAKERLVTSTGGRAPRPVEKVPQAGFNGRTMEQLGRMAGVSDKTIAKAETVLRSGDTPLINALEHGQTSISAAFNQLQREAKRADVDPSQKSASDEKLDRKEQTIRLIREAFTKAAPYIRQAVKHITVESNTKAMRRAVNTELDYQFDEVEKIIEARLMELGFDVWTVNDDES